MKKSEIAKSRSSGWKQHEAGVKTADLCRGARDQRGHVLWLEGEILGMDVSEAQRLKTMEDENRRLSCW